MNVAQLDIIFLHSAYNVAQTLSGKALRVQSSDSKTHFLPHL